MAEGFWDLVQLFYDGSKEGISKTKTLRIEGDKLIHYSTTIMERYDGRFILNMTRYSDMTRKLQSFAQKLIENEKLIKIQGVPKNYDGSIVEYLNQPYKYR